MSGNPERSATSWSHTFITCSVGAGVAADIHLTVNNSTGPSPSDNLHVFTVEQARTLAENLLQSIQDTEPKEAAATATVHYPYPPEDLAGYLYGHPYGEEST